MIVWTEEEGVGVAIFTKCFSENRWRQMRSWQKSTDAITTRELIHREKWKTVWRKTCFHRWLHPSHSWPVMSVFYRIALGFWFLTGTRRKMFCLTIAPEFDKYDRILYCARFYHEKKGKGIQFSLLSSTNPSYMIKFRLSGPQNEIICSVLIQGGNKKKKKGSPIETHESLKGGITTLRPIFLRPFSWLMLARSAI